MIACFGERDTGLGGALGEPFTKLHPLEDISERARDVSRQNSDGGWSDARDPRCLADCLWLHLSEPLDDFGREAWDRPVGKLSRDSTMLVARTALDVRLLAPEVALVFDGCLDTGDVEPALRLLKPEAHRLTASGVARMAVEAIAPR